MQATLIHGGTVFDGSGAPARRADVLLIGDRVAKVGDNLDVPAGCRHVDAAGCWVTPGFIDAHSHADLAVLTGEGMETRILSGVTTEIVGQDGFSLGCGTHSSFQELLPTLSTLAGSRAAEYLFSTVPDYLAAAAQKSFARVGALLPHANLRARVAADCDRALNRAELTQIAAVAASQVAPGVLGLSSGLSYAPARWAQTFELVHLLQALPTAARRYVTHLRDYGDGLDAALDEAFAIADRAHAHLHLSHFHVSGPRRDGRAGDYLARVDRATTAGMAISIDSYPYERACTTILATLPEWFQQASRTEQLKILDDSCGRLRLGHDLDELGPGATFAVGWDGFALTPVSARGRLPAVESVATAARDRGMTVGALVARYAAETQLQCFVLPRQGHRGNVLRIAQHRAQVFGSDGIIGDGRPPHPRATGTFLRALAWASTSELDLPVHTAVAKMTGRTARRFGVNLGYIAPSSLADLLVIDPAKLEPGPDIGSYTPTAVVRSWINGIEAVTDGRWTGNPMQGAIAA